MNIQPALKSIGEKSKKVLGVQNHSSLRQKYCSVLVCIGVNANSIVAVLKQGCSGYITFGAILLLLWFTPILFGVNCNVRKIMEKRGFYAILE